MASPRPPTMGELGQIVAGTIHPDAQHHFRKTIPQFVPQPHAQPTRILEVSEPRKILIQRVFTAILRTDPNFVMHQAQLGPLLSMDYGELVDLGPSYNAREILFHIGFQRDVAGMLVTSGPGAGFDKEDKKSRDRSIVDEARDRDRDTCTVTRLAICHMAHVLPFWATSTKGNVERTVRCFQSMSMMLSSDDFPRVT
ncbi:unnamed protein product [Fusarium equiseti]|uniref:Uncharacterized protein n=1 Tax=Fusarium equiseti TaxID=61235 RepID=A0A8J2J9Y0_FUSEQ|nr:unnamed protein product [Fusarium equiseti]